MGPLVARMAELVDASGLKSDGLQSRVGSTPTPRIGVM